MASALTFPAGLNAPAVTLFVPLANEFLSIDEKKRLPPRYRLTLKNNDRGLDEDSLQSRSLRDRWPPVLEFDATRGRRRSVFAGPVAAGNCGNSEQARRA